MRTPLKPWISDVIAFTLLFASVGVIVGMTLSGPRAHVASTTTTAARAL